MVKPKVCPVYHACSLFILFSYTFLHQPSKAILSKDILAMMLCCIVLKEQHMFRSYFLGLAQKGNTHANGVYLGKFIRAQCH